MNDINIIEEARRVLKIEAEAILSLSEKLGKPFEDAIEILLKCKNRVVLTGIGKAGIIARKIASTFASTGTPAFFMHPTEGVHGDLGMITPDNVVIAVSHSGNSEEILRLIPYFKHFKIPLIALTGDKNNNLAKNADVVLLTYVTQEACPLGLAPTASTTTTLALGDALAIVLLQKRGFKTENFAIFHPSGILGKRLLIKVSDLMHTGEANPIIDKSKTFKEGILEMTSKGLGAINIIDENGILCGIFTDGDLRRLLHSAQLNMDMPLSEVMIRTPKTISPDSLGVKAIDLMEQYNITVLPVVNKEKRPVGMIHLHDLIKAGIAP